MAKDEAKWAYWTKQIKSWQASGLTRSAYCQREGLKPTTFDYWRPLIACGLAEVKVAKQPVNANDITLVPVKVMALGGPMTLDHPGPTHHRVDSTRDVPLEVMALGQPLKLKSPAGREIQLPASIEPRWLITVLRQLP